jgi:four helix bundle protein
MDSYRSLDAWKVAHQLSLEVLRETDNHYHPKSRSLFDQIRRASVSIEINIVEGYALQARGQFRRHLKIALGSAAETECVLDLITRRQYLPDQVSIRLKALVTRIIGLIFGLLRSLGSG